ncbi:MAG: tRNA 2-thiouridine(34) synthase MnmA [Clostridia bacterium]|nr:tRNA 2-thiouridine(34) synthase MnmA [Clostridia bacterium]
MAKVLIAMSGGVDSSVAAEIIKSQGYETAGAIMSLYGDEGSGKLEDIADAKRVADSLNMPFYVFDFSEDFKKYVITDFVEAYKNALTPNPCVVCNKFIKFGAFLDKAIELGFDYVATGHYAKIEFDEATARYVVKKADDETKDQSYMLYSLSQEQLSKVLLPLGGLSKDDAREVARTAGFDNADKHDSQDICFIPDGEYAAFIERWCGKTFEKGEFVNKAGEFIAEHKGLINYTIGQRKGLGIAAPAPYYVLQKDAKLNRVVLGSNDDLFLDTLEAENVNFISVESLTEPMKVKAKVRYKQKETEATIYPLENGNVKVVFDTPQRAITPGQSVVFYDGDTVLGGGIIK